MILLNFENNITATGTVSEIRDESLSGDKRGKKTENASKFVGPTNLIFPGAQMNETYC